MSTIENSEHNRKMIATKLMIIANDMMEEAMAHPLRPGRSLIHGACKVILALPENGFSSFEGTAEELAAMEKEVDKIAAELIENFISKQAAEGQSQETS